MAETGWRHGSPAEPQDAGLFHVLMSYISQGGQLLGARRWADNPLTLTHVRWHGLSGLIVEARRDPTHDDAVSEQERGVWVQLALTMPTSGESDAGAQSPWLPLAVDPAHVQSWVTLLDRARRSSQSSMEFDTMRTPALGSNPSGNSDARYGSSLRHLPPSQPDRTGPRISGQRGAFDLPSGTTGAPISAAHSATDANWMSVDRTTPPSRPTGPVVPAQPAHRSPSASGQPFDIASQGSQFSGSWQRSSYDAPPVVVLACIEVEMPPSLLPGSAALDYQRNFARDVAVNFGQAVKTIPQARETRAWMRGDMLVLAAQVVVAMGMRAPNQGEMAGAVRLLAEALARRTLPYSHVGVADPGEWMQGAHLPE